MNGLPITIDLSPLIGRQLVQVCVGTSQLVLNFDCEVRIAIESTCIYQSPSEGVVNIADFAAQASIVCSLIGEQVIDASRDADGGLTLQFGTGTSFQITNSEREFESFQFHVGSQVHVA